MLEAQPKECYACGWRGHLRKECTYQHRDKKPYPEGKDTGKPRGVQPLGRAGRRGACFSCGKVGHVRRHCPHKEQNSTRGSTRDLQKEVMASSSGTTEDIEKANWAVMTEGEKELEGREVPTKISLKEAGLNRD